MQCYSFLSAYVNIYIYINIYILIPSCLLVETEGEGSSSEQISSGVYASAATEQLSLFDGNHLRLEPHMCPAATEHLGGNCP
tara:strand:- start:1573 stop:1818 length:246 start_codon:yes stop_codon:yes gene_type:complete